ncbi:hypothetical protein IMY05_012G0094700 [Salix suchowensis]|nr:hypothetical protein IMY05_012G0094700 [Salix suchowensis]
MMVLIKSELVISQNYCSQAEVILHQMYNLEDVYDPANDPLPAMGSGSFEPPGFNKTGFISYIQVHVKNENPPREPDVEALCRLPSLLSSQHVPPCHHVMEELIHRQH